MHNVDLFQDDALEFLDLPHRRCDRTSSSLDSGEIEVGREFSNKDSFLAALKQHNIMNGVNYNVVKFKSDKFEAKCAVQDDHPKMDSDMLASLILPTLKADPKTSVTVLIANICSQLKYTSSYRKVWIAKQKALEKMHAALFSKRAASYKGQMQGGHVWYAKVLREINKAKARANTMHIVCHDRDNLWFRVTEFDRPNQGIIARQYRAHLRNKTCDCGVFDALRYPCTHVIAACQNLRLDPITYVDQVYKIEYMYNMWRHVFPPITDERKWPPVLLSPFKLLPDRELHRKPKGRPCSTRICNNMDT
ncbi:hypothetical protein GOBAR_AA03578 [Gossypium barbadense]|uniref:SWIM-type domain-containing protein n=1 Tax=Gossypium barbadense TaxID=3634 RepID=A0A2P5YN76_GOSBA|nr:hypothetical protein GOBAR_AA03578 [Gossypium barbadense]